MSLEYAFWALIWSGIGSLTGLVVLFLLSITTLLISGYPSARLALETAVRAWINIAKLCIAGVVISSLIYSATIMVILWCFIILISVMIIQMNYINMRDDVTTLKYIKHHQIC